MKRLNRWALVVIAASVALTACDDDGGLFGPDDEGPFTIVMQAERASGAALRAPADPLAAELSLDVVESIVLPIGHVEALGTADGWVVAGSVERSVDLMALPTDGITLIDSSLPRGDYTALRFLLTDHATITLSEDVRIGRTLYEAGTHPLVIPSSEENGVRLRAQFRVDEDGEALAVLFDGDATVRRVTATGSGVLKIAPELRVENAAGQEVGGIDDDEGDDESDVEVAGAVASVSDTGFTLEDGTVVAIHDETEVKGDLLSLTAVGDALLNDEPVHASVEGTMGADGTTVVAAEVEFELDDSHVVEVAGVVTAVDRSGTSYAIDADGVTITVVLTEETAIDDDGDHVTFEAMADAFDDDVVIWAEARGTWAGEDRLEALEVTFESDDSA